MVRSQNNREMSKRGVKLKNKQDTDKQKRQADTDTKEDRLSKLPLDLRYRLLSLLPTRFAVQTCLLSSDWKISWKYVRGIRLDDAAPFDTVERVSLLHDRVMEVLDGMSLDELHMHLTRTFIGPLNLPRSWINDGVCKHITDLDLEVINLDLPKSFFTCRTLKKLKLRLEMWVPDVWEPGLEIHLPNLLSLDACAHQELYRCMFRLIGGSPVLESISFCGFGYIPGIAPLPMSPNIKRLEFHDPIDHGSVAIVHTLERCPMLEHLLVENLDGSPWVIPASPPPCMVERLKTLKVHHVGLKSIEFVRFALKNAKQMKKLEIICTEDLSTGEAMELSEEIEVLSGISKQCEVHLNLNEGIKDILDWDDLL